MSVKGHQVVLGKTTYGMCSLAYPMKAQKCPQCGVLHAFYQPEENIRKCDIDRCQAEISNPFRTLS